MEMPQNLHVVLIFDTVQDPLHLPHETTSERPKVAASITLLTRRCALGPNRVRFFDLSNSKSGPALKSVVHFDLATCFAQQRRHFFHMSTSKSGPTLRCFVNFDLDMCLAPQPRALCRHLNVHFDFEMCFTPQWRAIFHLSSRQMAPPPPL